LVGLDEGYTFGTSLAYNFAPRIEISLCFSP